MADSDQAVTFRWHGAAHYHLACGNERTVIDPFYSRLPGDKPHLGLTRDDADRIDHLLLTHAHLDHALDAPYLIAKHDPEVYAPLGFQRDVDKELARSNATATASKYHGLEGIRGKTFSIAGMEVTPYQIGTEEIDFWFIRSMFVRPWVHRTPSAIPAGYKWLTHHVMGNCFAFLFRLPPEGTTMLYFGNLTDQVGEIADVERVEVLAIPYCPANHKWLQQSQYLIDRFKPSVTLVHHFDNFLNPFTLSKYMNLDDYRNALHEECPEARLFFSKFLRDVSVAEMLAMRTG